MSLETALGIADREILSNPDKEIIFDLFGGEPFLEFGMIMEFCDTVWERYPDRKIRMSCITNGTLVNESYIGWMTANRHRFFCHISIDGTPEMHTLNRGEAFPMEGAIAFASIWPGHATAKMTLSPETVANLYEGVLYVNSLGLGAAPSLARGLDWNSEHLALYKEELRKLVKYFSDRPELRPIDLFKESLAPLLLEEMTECYCGAGHSMWAYTPEGEKYPCQMFAPFSLPPDKWNAIKDMDLRADRLFFSEEDCRICAIRNLCKKCPGLNYKDRGHTGKRDKRLCEFLRAEYLATAEYKIRTLLQKPFDSLSYKDYVEIKAAARLKEEMESSC